MAIAELAREAPAEPDAPEELWVQSSSNPDQQIRIRNLTLLLAQGGFLTDARLVEGLDDRWTMYVRIANRPGEHRVNVYRSDQPKTYRDVRLAVETIRNEFGWTGSITLATEKPAPKDAAPGPARRRRRRGLICLHRRSRHPLLSHAWDCRRRA